MSDTSRRALSLSGSARIRAFLDENPVWLAPMAGVNDACFRSICKRMGAGITYSEMISALGLHYNYGSDASQRLLTVGEDEAPLAVQLFGSDPLILAEQARAVAQNLGESLAFIDINMGCPVSKVIKKGEGSALMTTPVIASEIVSRTVESLQGQGLNGTDIPVTVKFRKGFETDHDVAVEFGQRMEEAGASALAVHGRYQEQFYSGESDKDAIRRVREAVTIPVIGSGDIFTPKDAEEMLARPAEDGIGADGVMIARGAQGNPWIFRNTHALLKGEEQSAPTHEEVFAVMHEHATCMTKTFGNKALVRMRKHATWYCTGLPGASIFRRQINSITSMGDLESLIDEYRSYLTDFTQRSLADEQENKK
jgi:nifR3 family TIM-barrel protein